MWKRKRQRTSCASGKETTHQKVFTLDTTLRGYLVMWKLCDRWTGGKRSQFDIELTTSHCFEGTYRIFRL